MQKLFKSCNAEIQVKDNGTFTAYGSTFGNVDSSNDRMMPGAFANTLKEHGNPAFCSDHDWSVTVGEFTHAEEDSTGLLLAGKFNLDQTVGHDLYVAYRDGQMDAFSIGGYIAKSDTTTNDDGIRDIHSVSRLVEVSTVLVPANDKARALTVKSLGEALTLRDLELSLRAYGYSNRQAQTLLSKARELFAREDVDAKAQAIAERLKTLVKG